MVEGGERFLSETWQQRLWRTLSCSYSIFDQKYALNDGNY